MGRSNYIDIKSPISFEIIKTDKLTNDIHNSRKRELEYKHYCTEQIELFFSGDLAPGKKVILEFTKYGNYCETPILMIKMDMNDAAAELKPYDLIENIELQIGGQQIDKIYDFNFGTLFKLYKLKHRVVKLDNNKICHCVPLPFDMFHGNNIFPLGLLFWHSVKILVELKEFQHEIKEMTLQTSFIHADLEQDQMKILKDFSVRQTQYTGAEYVIINKIAKYKLNFNHDTHLIYFMIIDKNNNNVVTDLVNRAIIQFNGHDKLVCEEDILIYNSKSILDINGTYCMPFTSIIDFKNVQNKIGSVNLSKIDTVILRIDFNDNIYDYTNDDLQLHISGLSRNILRFKDGTAGLAYSS
ncbi:MAG: major capsid protein VP54 [Terrestrivirus sp.]|uniref:Major capsid protein VP54 n=1 Tax=Terrestrivirus sp. TaxID=2487775 RepID=A0A3G4ZP74_9VIRU|nr:MAG: major capsid protein VP54 [Terrestrivirus sp.]